MATENSSTKCPHISPVQEQLEQQLQISEMAARWLAERGYQRRRVVSTIAVGSAA